VDARIVTWATEVSRNVAGVAWLSHLVSSLPFGLTLLVLGAALLWSRRRPGWAAAALLIALVFGTDWINHNLFKEWARRPRPCQVLVGLYTPDGCGPAWSMPSGHAATHFAGAAVIMALEPWYAFVVVPIAVLVALSRVFLGVHYLSDVVVGAGVGLLLGAPLPLLARRWLRDRHERAGRQRLRAGGEVPGRTSGR